ncbi:cytochrome-c peroxidase [Hymenobacter sp. HMF4947]|uniref:Cytochrome-c peroxidase n=1 Tax=Hymenobacter ginkgonis TaxID=2682976 RepID=A0A7K1TI44_9BACT|nr:cytochrome c peroxidase [Hymenobacter ginkgonis]MVN78033.1 cytochrome-c peroxidase [Hymenobacter ginkgonis]
MHFRRLIGSQVYWQQAALVWAGVALLGASSCEPGRPTAQAAVPGTAQPANFPKMVYELAKNQPNAATFALGRQLFYDTRLSSSGTVSCGSCHQQSRAFTDGQALAVGVGHRLSTRNAPTLQNMRWRRGFMADGGVLGLELQALAPLTSAVEMNTPLATALAKLNADPDYRRQFAAIYGPREIDTPQFLRALAQFTAALTSANSRYDHYVRHEAGGTLTAPELRGRALFVVKCAGCHATDLFTDESFRNNGLDRAFPHDSGRAHITSHPTDAGRFKVPSLRNVARTAPYMHDGRFATLPQVLAHYAHGVQPSPTLDPLLRQPSGRLGIVLSAQQQVDLLTFLNTLTDSAFLANPQLAPPQPPGLATAFRAPK